jgi:hypothetical protein
MSKSSNGAKGFEAEIHIATLRGLYGDLRESLDNPGARGELWTQIEATHGQLGNLLGGDGAADTAGSSAR